MISDPRTESPLDVGGYDEETLSKAGLFVVEKYLRLVDKEDQEGVPSFVKNRANKLHGVVNLKDFKQFINNNANADEFKYSDCFGDMRFVYLAQVSVLKEAGFTTEDLMSMMFDSDDLSFKQKKELLRNGDNVIRVDGDALSTEEATSLGLQPVAVAGSTGVKYGIRVCYVPPDGFIGGEVSDSKAMREKSLNVKQVGGPNTKYIVSDRDWET